MKLTVNNYRGIESAEVEINPIALIAGKNGAGKTSIAQAVAAVMTGNAAPVDGFKKNEAKHLVREGQKSGSATIDGAKITFPRGTSSGEGPRGSEVAAGLSHPLDMKPVDSAQYLSGLLQAEPTKIDLVNALPDVEHSVIIKIWDAITANGWDAAHKQARETGTKRKGQWEMVTGINYGVKVADGWVPPEFASGIPSRESLSEKLDAAKKKHADLMSSRAVSADMIERNKSDAARMDGAESDLEKKQTYRDELAEHYEKAAERLRTAVSKLDDLPKPGAAEITVPCPECGTHLVALSATELKKAGLDGPTDEENASCQKAIDDQRQRVSECQTELRQIQNDLADVDRTIHDIENTIRNAKAAADWLKGANTDGASDEDIEAAQHAIDDLSYNLSLIDSMEKAESLNDSINQSKQIADALAPGGVRQTVLTEKLGSANVEMAGLCSASGFEPVEITDDLSFTYGGREYRLLSESEAFRVRLVSQLYFSKLDGSQLVVIDRADLLDKAGRNGLFKAVRKSRIPAVICMTLDEPMTLPESLGRAYWVEGSRCA